MKTLNWIGCLASLAFLVAALAGCEQEERTVLPADEPMTISVYLYEDTLREWPCHPDTATVGFAVVSDRDGRAMGGVRVSLTVTPPKLGGIELADSVLRDTTNELGRVTFIFRASGLPGDATIKACVGATCDSLSVEVAKGHGPVASVALTLDKDTLWLAPGSPDSVFLTLCRYDAASTVIPFDTCSSGDGIPGIQLAVMGTGGRFRPFTGADSSGCAHAWWRFSYGEWGEFQMEGCWSGFCDTAFVFVDSL